MNRTLNALILLAAIQLASICFAAPLNAQQDIVQLEVSASSDSRNLYYRITPVSDITGCSYGLYVDHRRADIDDLPDAARRVASFTSYDAEINLISESLPRVRRSRSGRTLARTQSFFFRLLMTCEDGFRLSNISTVAIRVSNSRGVTPRQWGMRIRNNIRYDR